MKHALLTLSILMVCLTTQSAPITTEKAKENAMAFLTSGNMQRVKGNRALALVYTRNDTKGVKAPLFHVFNIGDGNGFVIASADDVAVPVLGYCDSGKFDSNDLPVNMQAWLDGYSEEISKARENGVVPRGDAPVYASRKKINPMIKSTWDQGAPYNDMCVFDGTRCVTGCVATGMAQIMYYWATTGIDGKKYRCGSTALPAYITHTNKYSVDSLDALASFDWDSMTDGTPTTTKGKTAVAQLMRYCGQSVKMDYEEDGSGAALEDAAKALKNNFDYNYSMQVVYSYDMPEEEWQEMAYNELNEGKPFFMSGLGTGGHAFICDGYDPADGKFHFNWGWGGDCDGWFAMTSLTPGGYNYSSMRWGIKGIQPFNGSPYVMLSTDGKTLSFYCDNKRKERTGTLYHLDDNSSYYPGWYDDNEVEHVVFDSSFSEARPVSTFYWFKGKTLLKDITGLSYLNTSEVTDMRGMFYDCNSLENIDVSHFDTSNVTAMSGMFYECKSLISLDVSHFNTSEVTNMGYMFKGCQSLKKLDVSHFDTSKVTNMYALFYDCKSLTNLDVSHFDTSKVTDMSGMFTYCSSLKSIDVSHFDTSIVTSMWCIFAYCNSLTSLDISNFDMSNVTSSTWLFSNCNSLRDLYIPASLPELEEWACLGVGQKSAPCFLHAPEGYVFNVDTSSACFKWYDGYFYLVGKKVPYGIINKSQLDIVFDDQPWQRDTKPYLIPMVGNPPDWSSESGNITSVRFSPGFAEARPGSTYHWFNEMKKLTTISGFEYLNTSEVKPMGDMFNNCSSLKEVDLSHFNTSNVTSVYNMFKNCTQLESLDVGHFDMTNVNRSSGFAYNCINLKFLRVAPGMETFADNAFYNVGDADNPCKLAAPTGFDFGFTPPANEAFTWKGGWFILTDVFDVFAMGDVNHDGQVNITDVTLMVDHILGDQPKTFHEENADMNHDGQINITDVTNLVNIILGQ